MGGAAAAGVGVFFKGALEEARDAQVIGARTENVIKSMGGAANISAKQVGDLAGALSNKAGVDDEAIQAGQNLLLTFGKIRNEAGKGNDIFNQTSALMVDMSRAMGTDAKAAALQLGKALNDPAKGVTKLARSGVSFTEQQTKQIEKLQESGDILGAQKIILGEVEKQFGGAAAAMATPADRAQVAWGNFQEELGTAVLPLVDKVLTAAADGLPKLAALGTKLSDAIGPAVKQAVPLIKDLVASFQGAGGGGAIASVFDSIRGAVDETVKTIGPAIEMVKAILDSPVGEALVANLKSAYTAVYEVMTGIIRVVRGVILVITGLFQGDFSKVWEGLKTIVSGVVKAIGAIVRHLFNVVKNSFKAGMQLARNIFAAAWRGLVKLATFQIRALVTVVRNLPRLVVAGIRALPGLMRGLMSRAWNLARAATAAGISAVVRSVAGLPGRLGKLAGKLLGVGRSLIQAFLRGLGKVGSTASSFAQDVWNALRSVINSGIDRLNGLLEFDFKVKGIGIHVNAPNIPHLAVGGRANAGALVAIGDGREPESVLPDSMLRTLVRDVVATAARGSDLNGTRLVLVLADGTQLDAYIDGRVGAPAGLAAQKKRAAWSSSRR